MEVHLVQNQKSSFIFQFRSSHYNILENKRRIFSIRAKKEESEKKPISSLISSVSSSSSSPYVILARSAIAVFGLGFIDAGYSGDWSRIGAISTETEDLLKAAAFVVVPLCIFLIFFSFSKEKEA